jgi:hypothetical protein
VFIIYIFSYCHIANYRKINIHPIVVNHPHFELKFEKVPIGIKTIFSYPDVMRDIKITKMSLYYTFWKYSHIFSDTDKMTTSLIGISDCYGTQLPPSIYHGLIILEENDNSEFIYIIQLCSYSGVLISKLLRSSCKCNNSKLNYIKPFLEISEEETFLMMSPVKLNSPSILELVSVMLYRISDSDHKKVINKIHYFHTLK